MSTKERCSHLQRFWARKSAVGETKREIAEFWRQKLVDEQDHLLYAIKAAARLRAHNLSEDDYKLFEESLKDDDDIKENESKEYGKNSKMRLGINDWWTKSKYAYLNEPAIDESLDPPKRQSSSYTAKNFSFNLTVPLCSSSQGYFKPPLN
ncbi:hypothetical protein NC651_013248 [Populus alba x Populus x berolinensis]|nr:hypothetical protein NC651_013248 [Populus alba x Populus x berolinensis]